MTYTHAEALAASLAYFGGDELAADVFVTKYALTDHDGMLHELTPADMHRRLAREFARVELNYPNAMSESEIFELLDGFKRIIAQGSPMSAIGNPYQVQSLSNCYVVKGPEDSYGGIFRADEEIAQIMKRRGGVGADVSAIRPKGMITHNAARTTDGIGVFMERFSNTCREVAQDGRRGALMLTCSVHHPEVTTFLSIKRDLKRVTGANVSLRVTDEFMRAVESDTDYEQRWPVSSRAPAVSKRVRARDVWREIIASAHKCAEPGVLFWDAVRKMSPADAYPDFCSESTNPCSELPLPPYDSCRLMLVNLKAYVRLPFTTSAWFDFDAFRADVRRAQRLMDDLVDLEIEAVTKIIWKIQADPEAQDVKARELALWHKIRDRAVSGRRTGLGLTSLGDMLAMLGARYGSAESVKMTSDVYRALAIASWESSIELAVERGAFPAYDAVVEAGHPFISKILAECSPHFRDMHDECGRRNIAITMSSPAGSASIEAQSTNAIEPVYKPEHVRRRKLTGDDVGVIADFTDDLGDRWKEYVVSHKGLSEWRSVTGLHDISDSPYAGSSAAEVSPSDSVKIQAAAQEWICHGISKTVNMSRDATLEDVERVYTEAWRAGCKGVTVYREGSRAGVLVSADDASRAKTARPKKLRCDIAHISVKGEPHVVLIGLHNEKPWEVFAGALSKLTGVTRSCKSGEIIKSKRVAGHATYNLEARVSRDETASVDDIVSTFESPAEGALTRMVSMLLRTGVPVQDVVSQLKKDRVGDIGSFAAGVARALKAYVPDGTAVEEECDACHAPSLMYQSGCVTCASCGATKCS